MLKQLAIAAMGLGLAAGSLQAQTRGFCVAEMLSPTANAIGYDATKKNFIMDNNNGVRVYDLDGNMVSDLLPLKNENIVDAKYDGADKEIIALTETTTVGSRLSYAVKMVNNRNGVRFVSLDPFLTGEKVDAARVFQTDGANEVYVITLKASAEGLQYGAFFVVDKARRTVRKLLDDQIFADILVSSNQALAMDVLNQVLYVASANSDASTEISGYRLRDGRVRRFPVLNVQVAGAITFQPSSNELVFAATQDLTINAVYLVKVELRRGRITDQILVGRPLEEAQVLWMEPVDRESNYVVHMSYDGINPQGENARIFGAKIVDFKRNKITLPGCRK